MITRMPRSFAVRISVDEVPERAEPRVDAVVVGDVVAVVAVGRGLERHQPQAADPDPREVVDALGQAADVADAVAVPVEERLDVEAVDRPRSSTTGRSSVPSSLDHLREDVLAEHVDEPLLLLAHVMEVDRVDAEVDQLARATSRAGPRSAETRTAAVTSSGRTILRGLVELAGELQVPREIRAEDVPVRHWSWAIASAVSSSSAHERCTWTRDRLPTAAALAERVDHAPEDVGGLAHGDQAVGPAADRPRGLLADGGAEQRRWFRRQAPDASPVDAGRDRRGSPPRRAAARGSPRRTRAGGRLGRPWPATGRR